MGTHVERHFRRAGLNVELVSKIPNRGRWLRDGVFYANVVGKGKDERFQIYVGKNRFQVLNVDKEKRHLLAHLQEEDGTKRKIVFGHDERHLFVAETGDQRLSTVRQALDSLAPEGARQKGVVRQGEWFFLPMQHLEPPKNLISKNENLPGSRNPHTAEFFFAEAYVDDPVRRRWSTRKATPSSFYVRGKITHSDHATVELDFWHKAERNLEQRGRAETFGFGFVD